MSIVDIVLIAWLLILTVIVCHIPGNIREVIKAEDQDTIRIMTSNISDWFRNHLAMYRHERIEDNIMPKFDPEKLAKKTLEVHLGDINPRTGRPYKTPKNVREAQTRYRNKKKRSKK